ncbi:hypothetical protein [Desulforamulus aquiferis]|uniref:Uncharacterized protein n=1 Tax=Desulforamulus aquiferis TaxID=1397668 RepID=A0AAW7ZEW5_9FIRM|nr:hypothetical protein [Desulforamulus aquiferis]MDO7787843.1 hypothetical protein [Desulforamulus aquiferis]RYD04051.1 hypothetical protein N752_16810 [Desulforamulus aquiferis]
MQNKSTMCFNISEQERVSFERVAELKGISLGELFSKYQKIYLEKNVLGDKQQQNNTGLSLGYSYGKPFYQVRQNREKSTGINLGYIAVI